MKTSVPREPKQFSWSVKEQPRGRSVAAMKSKSSSPQSQQSRGCNNR
jgi:hypothetical protein